MVTSDVLALNALRALAGPGESHDRVVRSIYAARDVLDGRLREEQQELPVLLPQLEIAMQVASDAAASQLDPAWSRRVTELLQFEIAFAQSPEVGKTALNEALAAVRNIYLLPLGAGGLESAHELAEANFVAAGEFALAGAAAAIVLGGGAALAERLIRWAQGP
jgi:hypothetical protein